MNISRNFEIKTFLKVWIFQNIISIISTFFLTQKVLSQISVKQSVLMTWVFPMIRYQLCIIQSKLNYDLLLANVFLWVSLYTL